MPKTYTVKEVADILGFSTNSIYTFLKEKRIRGVRIGKGRFRISADEVSRILHLSKKPAVVPAATSVTPRVSSEYPAPPAVEKQRGDAVFMYADDALPVSDRHGLLAPNIFDWFVGLGAIVSGIGLFLFNTSYTAEEFPNMLVIYPIMRLILITCGAGILISSLSMRTIGWKRIFQYLLVILGFVNTFGLVKSGDIEGAALYGVMAVMIVFANLFRFGGIVSVGLYVSITAFLYPLVILFFPADAHVVALVTALNVPSLVIGLSLLSISLVLLVAFWAGYAGNRISFLIAAWALGIGDVVVAMWYGHVQYWSRAFFFMNLATFTALLPYWWPLQLRLSRRYTLVLHGLFVGVGAVLILAIVVVYLLQQNLWSIRERDILNKVHLGRSRLINAITSTQSALVVASSNRDIVVALEKSDLAALNVYSKIIYESNPNIRRLVFLNEYGDGISLYPYGTFDEPNFAYRDYFQLAKNTGKPYISDVFQAKSDQLGRYVVVVAVPLANAQRQFSGIIAASIDLARMGMQLDEIASEDQGEYFVVADAKGIILSHPNEKLIGTVAPASDPLHLALTGKDGVQSGMMIEKIHGLMGYAHVPELRWAMSLRVPSKRVLGLASLDIWIIFGVVTFLLCIGIILISYIRIRAHLNTEGGP